MWGEEKVAALKEIARELYYIRLKLYDGKDVYEPIEPEDVIPDEETKEC